MSFSQVIWKYFISIHHQNATCVIQYYPPYQVFSSPKLQSKWSPLTTPVCDIYNVYKMYTIQVPSSCVTTSLKNSRWMLDKKLHEYYIISEQYYTRRSLTSNSIQMGLPHSPSWMWDISIGNPYMQAVYLHTTQLPKIYSSMIVQLNKRTIVIHNSKNCATNIPKQLFSHIHTSKNHVKQVFNNFLFVIWSDLKSSISHYNSNTSNLSVGSSFTLSLHSFIFFQ